MSETKQKSWTGPRNSILLTVFTNKNFWLALLIMITANVGNACVKQPVTLMGSDLGFTASALGFITSLFTIFAMLGRGPFGNAVDHSRHKTWVLAAQYVARGLVFIGFAFCMSQPMYIILKFAQGLTFGMGHIAMMLVIAETMDKRALGSAFGLIVLVPKLLSSVTNNITLQITTTFGAEYSCFAGAILSFVPAALCLLLTMPTREVNEPKSTTKFSIKTFVNYRAIPLILIMTFVSIPSLFVDNFMILYGKTDGMESMARDYITNYMWWMGIGSFLAGYAFDRFGFKRVGIALAIMGTIAQAILGFTTDSSTWFVSALLCGLACGGISVIMRSYAVKECNQAEVALTVATLGVMQDVASLVGTSAGGVLIDAVGFAATFQILTVFPAIALIMTICFLPKLVSIIRGPKDVKAVEEPAKQTHI